MGHIIFLLGRRAPGQWEALDLPSTLSCVTDLSWTLELSLHFRGNPRDVRLLSLVSQVCVLLAAFSPAALGSCWLEASNCVLKTLWHLGTHGEVVASECPPERRIQEIGEPLFVESQCAARPHPGTLQLLEPAPQEALAAQCTGLGSCRVTQGPSWDSPQPLRSEAQVGPGKEPLLLCPEVSCELSLSVFSLG